MLSLPNEILHFTEAVDKLDTPEGVLDALNAIIAARKINVLGAVLLPLQYGDTSCLEVGRTVFLHKSAPKGWWDEHLQFIKRSPSPGDVMARLVLAPYTYSEAMQKLEPLGVDRWSQELNLKYGIRDVLGCPFGGRWILAYWSKRQMHLSMQERALLFLGAAFAIIRLQALTQPFIGRLVKGAALTPRELSVLRLMADGQRVGDAAQHLGLGEETIRSHLKKAQLKLGARNSVQAIVRAIRLHLIP